MSNRSGTEVGSDSLLGGAERTRTRPRGFAPWTPDQSTRALLDEVQAVLDEYAAHLPLTIRQIFYRLVGAHDYAKTEKAYKRLCVVLQRMRRAKMIPMDVIRDDGGTTLAPVIYEDVEDFMSNVRLQAEDMWLDRARGQPTRLVVMCEAEGMAPQLERVAAPYGITVISGGGFDSVTAKYNLARGLEDTTEVLHIGDHDPSGVHLFASLAEDVTAFADTFGVDVTFTRLAVTPAQIARYHLPTAPPKPTDNRAFRGPTCQAEAIAPDDLAAILQGAITDRLDVRAYKRVLRDERKARRILMARLGVRGDAS